MASSSKPVILLVGRLSGPKNRVLLEILRQVAPRVKAACPRVRFQVLGGPVGEEHRRLEKESAYIHFEGHQKSLRPYYAKASVVVGAGRVALEAMALGKPVAAVGERLYIGPLSAKNIPLAKATNFGDCFEKEVFDWDQMARDLVNLVRNKKFREETAQRGKELLKSDYALGVVEPLMEALYQKVLLKKNLSLVHEIPVLMYHRVLPQAPSFTRFNLHVTQEDLERQILFLKSRGFEALTFQDLAARRLPRKPVILTFDDGYEDNYRFLFPLLQKHRMKAVIYILGDRKHKNNFWDIPKGEPEAVLLKPAQIIEMQKSGWVEWGAHSMNHRNLTQVSPKDLDREVEGCKKSLENFLQKPVLSFAYPYGELNGPVKKRAAEAGYSFGVAVNSGPTRFGEDLMEIRRVHMFPKTSSFEYFKKTSGWYLRYRRFRGKN